MKSLSRLIYIFLLLCVSLEAQEIKLPYEDHGACPFECCMYRKWSVKKTTRLRERPDSSVPYMHTVKQGESVDGITGVVITYQLGQVEVLNPVTVTPYFQNDNYSHPSAAVTFKPGEVLSALHYLGEGACLYWYKGRTVSLDIYCLKQGLLPLPTDYKVLAEPHTAWWVKVRANQGAIGWTDEDNFSDHDACG